MHLLVLPYLIISTIFIKNSTLYLAAGPKLYILNLTDGKVRTINILGECGSYVCMPFCVGTLGNKVVIGTSGSLIQVNDGKAELLLPYPVYSCKGSIAISVKYVDPSNSIVWGELLDEKLNVVYKGCGVISAIGTKVMSLVCNDGAYLKWEGGEMKLSAPAVLAGTIQNFIAVTFDGNYYVFENGTLVDQGVLQTPTNPMMYVSSWKNVFYVVWGGVLYKWDNGLYRSNLEYLVAAQRYKSYLIIAKYSNNKIYVDKVDIKSIRWVKVRKATVGP